MMTEYFVVYGPQNQGRVKINPRTFELTWEGTTLAEIMETYWEEDMIILTINMALEIERLRQFEGC